MDSSMIIILALAAAWLVAWLITLRRARLASAEHIEQNARLQKALDRKTRTLHAIMASTRHGVLLLEGNDEDLRIGEASEHALRILGRDTRGQALRDTIFADSHSATNDRFPKKLRYRRTLTDERLLELEWFPAESAAAPPMILILHDVTVEKKFRSRLVALEGKLFIAQKKAELNDRGTDEVRISLMRVLEQPLQGLFEAAHILQKPEPAIRFHGPIHEDLFSQQDVEALAEVFTHVLRNAIDHGVESAPERIRMGKSGFGTITIHLLLTANVCQLTIEDDGRGLDLGKLRSKLQNQDLADQEAAEAIFLPDFSTRDHISDISGRGVGLYAAREAVRELQGEMTVDFTGAGDKQGFRPFQFTLQLPARSMECRASG